uniref:Spectrin repeats metazoan domain-containing protein n=1 Tax=Romanomermis culicivorax TaxID=13658 RepID=A0A915I2F5_ROMCU
MIRDQVLQELMDKFSVLNNWLTNVGESNLFTMNDMGTNLPTAGDFLERHKILANDVRTRNIDFKDFMATADRPDIQPGDPQYEEVYTRTRDLKNRWEKFERLLENRIKLGEIYYEFHRKAAKLTSDMDSLDSLVKNLRDLDPYSQNQFENRWSTLNNDFQDLKRSANDFASQSHKSSDDGRLNIRGAQRCIDAILDDLGGRRVVVGHSWADAQTKMKKDKEIKQYWDNFVAECGKILDSQEVDYSFEVLRLQWQRQPIFLEMLLKNKTGEQ